MRIGFLYCAVMVMISSGLTGCATVKETAKGIAGISTKSLEAGRQEAVTKIINQDYSSCYNKTKDSLQQMGAYIYSQGIEKHMIAIYVSREDTTPVGIFFEELGKDKIQIEVSSPSTRAKELIANKLFTTLEKTIDSRK